MRLVTKYWSRWRVMCGLIEKLIIVQRIYVTYCMLHHNVTSKAYDSLPHDLLIAKLDAYGLSHKTLKLILDYLSDRKHRVKIGSTTSSWLDLLLGVPQGSILGPLLFIYIY